MQKLIIKNGRVIDPENQIDGRYDVVIENGFIVEIGKKITGLKTADEIDAQGNIVAPGFIDLHVHFREPGFEYKETILTGSQAAAAGGFTSVCCMANTNPVNDNGAVTSSILKKAKEANLVNVFPIGSVTKNLEGKELAEIGELKSHGCVALSDDGKTIQNPQMMRLALEYAKSFNLPIVSHCLCPDLTGKGVMNEGFISTELGLAGIPHEAEDTMVARDIALAELTDAPVHIAHLSTARSVELVREAKKRKVKISCEVTPHHFSLTDEACRGYDPNTKMAPPLRTEDDIRAIKKGLADKTIDAIATDHAPHSLADKEVGFQEAPCGIIGLETAFHLALKLVHEKTISLNRMIELFTSRPSKIFNLNRGSLAKKAAADLVIFSTDSFSRYEVSKSFSKSKNSPFEGWKLPGKILYTLVGGRVVYEG